MLLFGISQSVTWYFASKVHQHRKSELKSKHTNAYYTFTYSQFQKAKRMAKDEILIDGKMFDINTITFEHNRVILYGHFDQKEDRLLAKSKDHESKKESRTKNFKVSFLYFENLKFTEILTFRLFKDKEHFMHSVRVSSIYESSNSPPPKFV